MTDWKMNGRLIRLSDENVRSGKVAAFVTSDISGYQTALNPPDYLSPWPGVPSEFEAVTRLDPLMVDVVLRCGSGSVSSSQSKPTNLRSHAVVMKE